MSLSRLSPRSQRKNLSAPKFTSSRNACKDNHLSIWQAIQNTRTEILRWQQHTDMIEGLFQQHILPREYRLTTAVQALTEKLIHHFDDASLTTSDKSLLGLWVNENLSSLRDHPFARQSRTATLNENWLQKINHPGTTENQLSRLYRCAHSTTVDAHGLPADDASLTTEPSFTVSIESESQFNTHTEHAREQTREETCQTDLREDTSESSTENLRNGLCVERLFRQLAKVLHPDREQDEQAKASKHELMSQCLKARDDKDIDTLLRLYCEHVGELPEDIRHEDYDELIKQLKKQLNQLQTELRQLRFGDPMRSMIVERYAGQTKTDSESRIAAHAMSIEREINTLELLCAQLHTINGLQDALAQRRVIEQDKLAIDELTGATAS